MQKNLYLLMCLIIYFAFIPTANAIDNGPIPPIDDGPIFDDESAPTTFDNGPISTIDDPSAVFNTNEGISSQSSIEMQMTGLPLSLIILAISLVFSGFIGFKRK